MSEQTLEQVRVTAADFAQLPETTQPTELIDGEIIVSPSPRMPHQRTAAAIYTFINDLIRQDTLDGEVAFAPLDVYINPHNVVQPDVFVVLADNPRCALGDDGYWHGAPDLIVEILSPGSARRDRINKFQLYEKQGVREYWLVEPELMAVEVWGLTEGLYQLQGTYSRQVSFTSPALGVAVDLGRIFPA